MVSETSRCDWDPVPSKHAKRHSVTRRSRVRAEKVSGERGWSQRREGIQEVKMGVHWGEWEKKLREQNKGSTSGIKESNPSMNSK